MKRLNQEPETFDLDSLPIGIEELGREEGRVEGEKKGKRADCAKYVKRSLAR